MTTGDLFHNPQKLRRIVGVLAFVMPPTLFLIGLVSPQVCTYQTISDYYFAPLAGDIFVGILFFMGFFLISYKGQADYGDSVKWDKLVSTIAGVSAIGIAIAPVNGYSCHVGSVVKGYVDVAELCRGASCGAGNSVRLFMSSWTSDIHAAATVTFFLSLACISFFLFTKTGSAPISSAKSKRNVIYKCSAIIIVLVMPIMGVRIYLLDGHLAEMWDNMRLSFWLETLGLFSFGFSWWVKGEGLAALND